ncbi:hypothetical protein [Rhodanobacter sp. A1T4]|jgi:hypothetical protein|uniref:hypothetical protein n=1 Tax=Rhodanobacter sp. A1T4 TaxID=2723087 RepID=UPI00160736F0|nr:hypothetical protein [Rhodanobacter sp. A1T4]MBB6247221.1 hypothetical protein [Rhodanobacter sp. A1T4]
MKSVRNVSSALNKAWTSTLLGTVIGMAMITSAHADDMSTQMVDQYADMCANQSINMPPPYGEGDLKGNPKLATYCKCFAGKFATRAAASLQNMNSGKPDTSSVQDTVKEEREMRNSCRQQVGLPLIKFS